MLEINASFVAGLLTSAPFTGLSLVVFILERRDRISAQKKLVDELKLRNCGQQIEIVEQKALIAGLHRDLQAEVAKKVCRHRYTVDPQSGWWPRKHKQAALCVVMHGKDVVDVNGDLAYLERYDIPKELKLVVQKFLAASGTLPLLKLVKAA